MIISMKKVLDTVVKFKSIIGKDEVNSVEAIVVMGTGIVNCIEETKNSIKESQVTQIGNAFLLADLTRVQRDINRMMKGLMHSYKIVGEEQ